MKDVSGYRTTAEASQIAVLCEMPRTLQLNLKYIVYGGLDLYIYMQCHVPFTTCCMLSCLVVLMLFNVLVHQSL